MNEFNFDDFKEEDLAPLQEAETPLDNLDVEPATDDMEADIAEDTRKEYMVIFDSMMFEGKYEERISLGKNYHIVLQTRTAEQDMKVTTKLDSMEINTMHAYSNMQALFTIPYALAEINSLDLRQLNYQEAFEKIKMIPSVVLMTISGKLQDFDIKVRSALTYGTENF